MREDLMDTFHFLCVNSNMNKLYLQHSLKLHYRNFVCLQTYQANKAQWIQCHQAQKRFEGIGCKFWMEHLQIKKQHAKQKLKTTQVRNYSLSFILIHGVEKKLCHVEKIGNVKIIKIYKAEFHSSLIEVESVLLFTHSVVIFQD